MHPNPNFQQSYAFTSGQAAHPNSQPWNESAPTPLPAWSIPRKENPLMANANKKKMGAGTQGKGDGTAAMTELPDDLPNNLISNRDKAHSDQRGLDSAQQRELQEYADERQVE